jgi:predicted polyphosphate/ATP-dependent NAD kinase
LTFVVADPPAGRETTVRVLSATGGATLHHLRLSHQETASEFRKVFVSGQQRYLVQDKYGGQDVARIERAQRAVVHNEVVWGTQQLKSCNVTVYYR